MSLNKYTRIALIHKLIETYTTYYKFTSKSILENTEIKLYWNRAIITDRTINSNRSDIVLTIKNM